ncbi:MAG: EutN/CcmL family microcompartment protein [Pirellulales bacterium]
MRIAKVIGTVTLVRSHPLLQGGSYRLAVPMSLAEIADDAEPAAEPLVVYDELGSRAGDKIALSESREAAMPFYPEVKPIDAYCAALLDEIYVG